jgi:ABC-type proline/glycine betaine transport system permease subunit
VQHLRLVAISLLAAILLGVPIEISPRRAGPSCAATGITDSVARAHAFLIPR